MKYLVLFLLAIVMVSLPSCKSFNLKKLFGHKPDTMAIWLVKQENIRLADSTNAVRARLQAIEDARLDSIRMAEEARQARASKYNIIVGAFITPEYARAWADEYRTRGYDVAIIPMEGSRFELVTAEVQDNAGRAITRLNQFQDTVQVDAWIYKKN